MSSTPKKEFYSITIKQQKNHPKELFNVIDILLHKDKDHPLPPHETASELAEECSDYVVGKVEKIRYNLIQVKRNNTGTNDEVKMYTTEMSF